MHIPKLLSRCKSVFSAIAACDKVCELYFFTVYHRTCRETVILWLNTRILNTPPSQPRGLKWTRPLHPLPRPTSAMTLKGNRALAFNQSQCDRLYTAQIRLLLLSSQGFGPSLPTTGTSSVYNACDISVLGKYLIWGKEYILESHSVIPIYWNKQASVLVERCLW